MKRADASRAHRGRQPVRSALFLLILVACYGHPPRATPPVSTPPAARLPPPQRGRYEVRRGGERLGEERFTITTTGARWRAEGERVLDPPREEREAYALELVEGRVERLRLRLELAGGVRELVARRRGDYLELEGSGIGPAIHRRVPALDGTAVLFTSPLASAVAGALHGPKASGQEARVRAILLVAPLFEGVVIGTRLVPRGSDAEGARLEIRAGETPIAAWLRPDGLPVRWRSFAAQGPPLELTLVESSSVSAAR